MERTTAKFAAAAAAAISLAGAAAVPALASSTQPERTTLTLRATKETPKGAHAVKASVVGHLRAHHQAVAGETVSLYERSGKGKDWSDTGMSQVTDSNGAVTFTFTQTTSKQQYRLEFAGDSAATPALSKSHSGVISILRAKS